MTGVQTCALPISRRARKFPLKRIFLFFKGNYFSLKGNFLARQGIIRPSKTMSFYHFIKVFIRKDTAKYHLNRHQSRIEREPWEHILITQKVYLSKHRKEISTIERRYKKIGQVKTCPIFLLILLINIPDSDKLSFLHPSFEVHQSDLVELVLNT